MKLKTMVRSGTLDLATAQHDLATNWIAAYKKYLGSTTLLLPRIALASPSSQVSTSVPLVSKLTVLR